MRRLLIALAAVAAVSASASAQKTPKRPKLFDGADTNDARAYLEYGTVMLKNDPEKAGDAFYWATRLDPANAEAFYARRVAYLLANPRRYGQYQSGDKRVIQSKEMQQMDSLLGRALMLNPVFVRRHERTALIALLKFWIEDGQGGSVTVDQAYIDRMIDEATRNGANEDLRAEMAYADGDYSDALRYYVTALKSSKDKAGIHVERGRIFLQTGHPDSAYAEFGVALDEMRKKDKKDFVVFYNSKASLEVSRGIASEQAGRMGDARAAYSHALEEDLAYYPAHLRLGYLALDSKDTTTALSELDLAAQLRPDDGLLHQRYGYALMSAGKNDAAIEQLKKATELEPFYALGFRQLGEAYEAAGKKAEAATAYKQYLAVASRSDNMRGQVEAKLPSLAGQ
ncbi:MAG: hypothetical protein JWO05_2190 [Gemmatimonadetes bacterium]|nr:hypothetical protein [Gemmatimonadota bacterium]